MKKRSMLSWVLSAALIVPVLFSALTLTPQEAKATESISASQAYVNAMGTGWNLGNTFDGFNDNPGAISDETQWGNPRVTRELIQSIKARGYDSIRMPLTLHTRYSNIDGVDVIDEAWLDRYAEVVQWAVDSELYVMVNIHHDSWIWLRQWNGNKTDVRYLRFVSFWDQIADRFKDFDEKVHFETINEPQFDTGTNTVKQQKLDDINLGAYHAIRSSGGKNDTRMIVMPTMHTNHEQGAPLLALIQSLNDDNIIATVHYYSEWVYSANLGITSFDEYLWDTNGVPVTPRTSLVNAFNRIYNDFTANGIGVVIGEFGLLGYDAGMNVLQVGEELKYYEFAHHYGREKGFSIQFWDNASGIDRRAEGFPWRKPTVGKMLEASMIGRSSYATNLDTIFVRGENLGAISIPLTLNGNSFIGIDGLTRGVDYVYKDGIVTLYSAYVKSVYNELAEDQYGQIAELVFKFSSGSDWHQYLVKYNQPVLGNVSGTNNNGVVIPVSFNGSQVRRARGLRNGQNVGGSHTWWRWLQYPDAWQENYTNGTINIKRNFFSGLGTTTGNLLFEIEFYDGSIARYNLNRTGTGGNSAVHGSFIEYLSVPLAVEIDPVDFSGFLDPIIKDADNEFKINSTIPLKFELKDIEGNDFTDVRLYLAEIVDGVAGMETEIASSNAEVRANLIRKGTGGDQYIYNFNTRGLKPGSYQLRVDNGGNSINAAVISLR